MKRKRESIERKTEMKSPIEELSLLIKLNYNPTNKIDNDGPGQGPSIASTSFVSRGILGVSNNNDDGCLHRQVVVSKISTRPFISICSSILQILDRIGPTMAVLRQDVSKNIQRLEKLCDSNPGKFSYLVEILEKEAVERNAKKGDTCSKALVWLTRCLDFTAAWLTKLITDPRQNMKQIVGDAYDISFKPWHGWISTAAFKVALKLVPDTDTFINLLKGRDVNLDTLINEIQTFLSLLVPLLDELHSTLNSYGVDKLKSV